MKQTLIILFLALNTFSQSYSQIINAYAKVISTAGVSINLSNVNETYDTFEDGESVIIMQMQDDVIGTNTNNNASFGSIASIASAGLYEIVTISSHTENAGLPNALTFTNALTNTYNIGSNASVQIISFPEKGSPNFTTTADILGLPWNGSIGGVIAIKVQGTLNLAHNICANGIGFRGGCKSEDCYFLPFCQENIYMTASGCQGEKGEGIYKIINANYSRGRGRIANGGGSGVEHNSGGAGGGNYTAGGIGGWGYTGGSTGCTTLTGGIEGTALNTYISSNRIFMGGGGGGGQQNNASGGDGRSGGGIIFIQATELLTQGSSSKHIETNGAKGQDSNPDGAGGGGAGGTVVFSVSTFNISPMSPINVTANGGNGGNCYWNVFTSGGGGGGQGIILYTTNIFPVNVCNVTLNGIGGCNVGDCTTRAGNGSGSDNTGIIASFTPTICNPFPNTFCSTTVSTICLINPLPIHLTKFEADIINQNEVLLKWETASELDNYFFTIERIEEGQNISEISRIYSLGNSIKTTNYEYLDKSLRNGNYLYRLKQTDISGENISFDWKNVVIQNNPRFSVSLFPNPVLNVITVKSSDETEFISLELFDLVGKVCKFFSDKVINGETHLDVSDLNEGIYYLKCINDKGNSVMKTILIK